MKNNKNLWIIGLLLLICTAAAAYWYSVNLIKWNIPLYGVCLALFFILGAAGFALLSAAKERSKKRLLPAALLGGTATVGGVAALSFFVNNILFHENGARFATIATAAFGCALALVCVLRLKRLTRAKLIFKPLIGILLAVAVFAAGFAGTVVAGFRFQLQNHTAALRKAAAEELSAAEKLYGTDALRREDGTLTVAFIGGSLTEGTISYKNGAPHSTNVWTEDVLRFLENKYPKKTLRAINAGKGGTNSQYGAARFGYDVEPYAPDLLFIEFSVNDSSSTKWLEQDDTGAAQTQLYLEYMLRRCLQMKKEPVVIYLHTPLPTGTETDLYRMWKEGADLKTALCEHYGVGVIDIYQALHDAYENAGTNLPLEDWLVENDWYRPSEDGAPDVHPNPDGYRTFYSAAVVGALEKDWDALIRQPKHAQIYCKNETAYLNGTYSYVECTDRRLRFSGGWRIFKNAFALWLDPSQDTIPFPFLEYPHFEKGIAQVKNRSGASFSYETDADELGMAIISSVHGLSATVLCGEQEVGELRCGSPYNNMEFPAGTVSLPDDGTTRQITVRIEDPTEDASLFRFGYLIEFRYGDDTE